MKLLFAIEHLDPSRGGAETYVAQFARECLRRGHEVHVVTQSAADAAREIGVALHLVDAPGATRARKMLAFDVNAGAVARDVAADVTLGVGKTTFQNVFQPHGGTYRGTLRQNRALVRGALPGALRDLRSALSAKEKTYLDIERRQYAAPGVALIALSNMVRNDMLDFYHPDESRIHLVYNGVDTERFDPERIAPLREATRARLGIGEEELALLIVAHNFKLKGVSTLLAAVAALAGEVPVRAVIVGKGKGSRYQRLAARLGVAERALFVGPAPDVDAFYAAADVYCQPTWYDPCSLVVLEALACGVPVITSRFNGAGELMMAGREGYVMRDPGDARELAQFIRKLADPAAREAARQAARTLALDHTLDRNFNEMLTVFQFQGVTS